VRSGGSYLSQNDLRLHFGLGDSRTVQRIEIAWPSGARQVLEDQAVDRIMTIKEKN
jgi:enediyne biosynthesis protein E4